MLDFWRLDTVDDFFLVAAPTWEHSKEIRAYHLELINLARSLPHHYLVEADAVLYENYAPYYQKLGDRLSPSFDCSSLTPHSRHSFFVAAERRGEFWISGLELLMGYDYEGRGQRAEGRREGVRITSGDFDIDVLAELLLLPNPVSVEWLVRTRSPQQLAVLTKQVSDRLRGKEALDELQQKQDLERFELSKGAEALKKAGFKL